MSLDPAQVSVTAGADASARIRVFNRGAIVDKFSFELPAELGRWVTIEPADLNLYPNTSAEATLHFRPPRTPAVPAGQVPLVVMVRSDINPDTTAEAEGTVTVEPFVDLAGRLAPNTSRSTGTAEHQIKVGNGGNAPADISISVTNVDDLLEFQFDPERVTLQPGEGTSIKLRVTPRDPDQIAQGVPQSFQVTLAAPGTPDVTLDGAYTYVTRVELEGKLDPDASSGARPAEHWVTISNKGNAAAAVAVSASDPGQLLTFLLTPSNLIVEPGGSERVQLRVGLRRRADPEAGESRGTPLPFQVVARAVDAMPVELNGTHTPLFIEIAGTLEPRISRSRTRGRHSLTVANNGNRTANVSITAVDPEEALELTVTPSCLTIAPGKSVRTQVGVRLRDPSSLGGKRAHEFKLQLTSDGSAPVTVEGAFVLLFGQITGTLDPPTSKSIGTGDHWVVVENTGNLHLKAALYASDPLNEFAFELNPATVSLAPGETARARLWLALRRRPRGTGKLKSFHVHIAAEGAPPVTVEGTRVQVPAPRQPLRWPPILLRVLMAISCLAVGALIAFNKEQTLKAISIPQWDRTLTLPAVSLAALVLGVIGFITFIPRREVFMAVGFLGVCAVGVLVLSGYPVLNM